MHRCTYTRVCRLIFLFKRCLNLFSTLVIIIEKLPVKFNKSTFFFFFFSLCLLLFSFYYHSFFRIKNYMRGYIVLWLVEVRRKEKTEKKKIAAKGSKLRVVILLVLFFLSVVSTK